LGLIARHNLYDWGVYYYDDLEFQSIVSEIPQGFIDFQGAHVEGNETVSINYLFPWSSSQTWWQNGLWHGDGYFVTENALDFQPFGEAANSVLASAQGLVDEACRRGDELWIQISNSQGITGYGHLDARTVRPGLMGRMVRQGQYLGELWNPNPGGNLPSGACGSGHSPHLHFVLPSKTTVIDGVSADTMGSDARLGVPYTSSNIRVDEERFNTNVIMCSDYYLSGICESFSTNSSNLAQNPIGDNIASSLFIPAGWEVVMWQESGYQNTCFRFDAISSDRAISRLTAYGFVDCGRGQPNMSQSLDNAISSIEVTARLYCSDTLSCDPVSTPSPGSTVTHIPTPAPLTGVILYEHPNYQSLLINYTGVGSYNLAPAINDLTSSVRVPAGWSVQVFEHADLQGSERCINSDNPNLADWTFDSMVSSVKIFDQPNCPRIATNEWYVEYFDNIDFSDRRCTETIAEDMFRRDWNGSDSRPCQAIGTGETWSARFTASFNLTGGTYVFRAEHDDGVRWSIDGQLVLASWAGAATTWSEPIQLSSGVHSMTIEFRQNFGGSRLFVDWWGPIVDWWGPSGLPWPPPTPTPDPARTLLSFPDGIPPIGFGTGADGNIVVTSGQTLYTDAVRTLLTADTAVGAIALSVTDVSGFSVGNEVLIYGSQGPTAGRYRFGRIASVGSGQIVLASALDLFWRAHLIWTSTVAQMDARRSFASPITPT